MHSHWQIQRPTFVTSPCIFEPGLMARVRLLQYDQGRGYGSTILLRMAKRIISLKLEKFILRMM